MMRAPIVLAAVLAAGAAHTQNVAQDYAPTPVPTAPSVVDPAGLADPQLVRGKAVFDLWCVACHGGGAQKPGTTALAAKYGDTLPALLEERTDLTPELTALFVRNGVSIMAPFRKTEISDADLTDLAAYLARQR